MTHTRLGQRQAFYSTALCACPYLPGRRERKIITDISGPNGQAVYEILSQAGFRRSYRIAYRPACPGCNACVSTRVLVAEFRPGRTMRRIEKANGDLAAATLPARVHPEHYALFARYERARHRDGGMASMTHEDYRLMVEEALPTTVIYDFRRPGERPLGVCLADRLEDGLSAVYSFFEPEAAKRSLGTFMILWLIEEARRLGLPHVYLGYWIKESPKMAYKARFLPAEVLAPSGWRRVDHPEAWSEPAA